MGRVRGCVTYIPLNAAGHMVLGSLPAAAMATAHGAHVSVPQPRGRSLVGTLPQILEEAFHILV